MKELDISKINEWASKLEGFANLHPMQYDEDTQGALQIMFELQNYLKIITGMDAVTLQPCAGAHGEFCGMMLIKKYFEDIWQKTDNKMKKVAVRSYDKIPYTAINGVHDDRPDIEWWTNGFWPGMMWIMYAQTKNERYMKTAINAGMHPIGVSWGFRSPELLSELGAEYIITSLDDFKKLI